MTIEKQYAQALTALRGISMTGDRYREVSDESLLELTRLCAQVQQAATSHAAFLAGEIARRSARELGHAGLAQAAGHRTPEELLRTTTGSTATEAARAVRVGRLVNGDDGREWLAPVGVAIADDGLGVSAAEAIATGLGTPDSLVSAGELAAVAVQLCVEAASLDADRLLKRARQLRDELDEAGVGEREAARREQRSLTFFRRADGMSRLTWLMDPETAALVGEVYDRATAPQLGGPRFVDPETVAPLEGVAADPRLPAQRASDVFTQLLLSGSDADSSQLLSSGAPSVRVVVSERALRERHGHGFIEGQTDPVSMPTVERLACTGFVLGILFDGDGQPLKLGREQRLYSRWQRIALAARDGGCRWPGCERPPSWTEAHHIHHWQRDGGRTYVADGILLCRHHHLLLHNDGWQIRREGGDYWLVPSVKRDPMQRPMPMPTKSRVMGEVMAEAQRELALA